jgi:hypothetical protein
MEGSDADTGNKEHQGQRNICGGPSKEAHHGACDPWAEDHYPSKRGPVGEVADERLKQGRKLKERCECARRGIGKRETRNEVWEKGWQEGGERVMDGMSASDRCDIAGLELASCYRIRADNGFRFGHNATILLVVDP